MGLEEYNERLKIIMEIVINPILNSYGVVGPDRLKYRSFVEELCKASDIDGLINKYVKEGADRGILEWIAERRDSICNALKSGRMHNMIRKLERKYVEP
jgi:hypothetical protein